ncbi:GumC family protein [Calothrix sp. UHCC 0171]|uniref:GumC family protein n=1 Tax=Calothrix sp. UHCC 0171 TaxID=3110245 RepID=UPI002B1E9E68|nr:lipopolysaccharide biosynthesis [Calothrix sp. UHCC 0171]MEA5569858.1 lipopolysaccharide biosynthesis [Calothrix sp. UHCC 0171]
MTPPIVKRYLIAFEKYKWIGLASFALVVAGSTVVAMQPEPPVKYLADAALTYSGPPISFSAIGSEIQQKGQTLTPEDLLSEPIVRAIIEKTKLKPKQLSSMIAIEFPKAPKPGETGSNVIELKYQDTEQKRAAEVLQILMQAAVKLSGERNTGQLKSIIGKIEERLPQAKKELEAAEQKLEAYDRVERPAILAAENGSLLTAVTTSQSQQRLLQQTLIGIDAQIRSLQSKLGLTPTDAYVSSALSADPILNNLRSQIFQVDSQIEVLKKDLRPQHPTMVQLMRQKEASEKLFRERANEVVSGGGNAAPLPASVAALRARSNLDPARQELANQLVALQTQRDTLIQQLNNEIRQEAKLRQEYSLIPNKQLERNRLEQQILLKKAVYDQMQLKITDAKTAEAETVSSLSIARPPRVIADVKPPKSVPVTLGAGGFFAIIVGGGVIFLLGSLEGTFKTQEDIRDNLKQKEVALLGELPLLPVDDLEKGELPVIISPESPYLEYYEKFRSNLRRIGNSNLKVVLITSVGSSEGKTISAYNLGIASARAGKRTLIIETDLRSPSYCESLGVTVDPNATIEPLRYYASPSECVRLVPQVENLYIVPSPGPVRNSAAIIESSEIRRLMEDAKQRFDFVILDTSPLGLSNDPLLIQPYSDGIIMVARPNYTQESVFSEAIEQLSESDMDLLGAIVNGADIIVAPPQPVVAVDEIDKVAANGRK